LKQLTVVRHAKSSWKYPDLVDHDRPLNKRGERDAPTMGDRLAARGYRPELVISSSANRALTTAMAIADAVGYPPNEIVVEQRIYGIGVTRLIALVQEMAEAVDNVMVFGHNPTMTQIIGHLSSESLDNLPTCGVAQFVFDFDSWAKLGEELATEVVIDYPKKLNGR
jgi:phosphohistidine phosphatase